MPPRRTNPQGYQKARELRKALTPAERSLWAVLRNNQLGVEFRRQHAVGPYIADFCCIKKKLIIELDGSQHLDQAEYDRDRTAYLEANGFRVLRFWNSDTLGDLNGVVQRIQHALEEI